MPPRPAGDLPPQSPSGDRVWQAAPGPSPARSWRAAQEQRRCAASSPHRSAPWASASRPRQSARPGGSRLSRR
eukprot:6136050-Alexandrium_andersonii.AAC.1